MYNVALDSQEERHEDRFGETLSMPESLSAS